jgi:hypothetical protein
MLERRDLLVAIPSSIFLLHASLFWSWTVDDAGISFAYAHNLARGYGLVAQPGVVPVEGYSNLLWVLILVPFFVMHLFNPILTPKLLAHAFVFAGFYLYLREAALQRHGERLVAVAGLSLAGLQSSLVIWCVSGLETGLYVLLLVLLTVLISSPRYESGALIGIVSAEIAMTRPEGILYSLAYPAIAWRRSGQPGLLKALGSYACGLALPLGAFLAFRIWYFGDVLPNTYYAKGGPTLGTIGALLLLDPAMIWKAGDLSLATGGVRAGAWLVVLGIGASAAVRGAIRASQLATSVQVMLVLSFFIYLLLPYDWMNEYRFAAPFFLFFYLHFANVVWFLTDGAPVARRRRILAYGSAMCLIAVATVVLTVPRSVAFATSPVIPITEVMDTAKRFEHLAEIAEVEKPSLLIADVGGALLSSRLRIYDLGMLSDRIMARSLGEGSRRTDQKEFYDYTFEKIRPTFIATRAHYSWIAKLDGDPRFRRDYVAIVEYPDEWIRRRHGLAAQSGDFVRRDVLGDDMTERLVRLRHAVRGTHYVGCEKCE